jgi:SdpI/YfhL protein family
VFVLALVPIVLGVLVGWGGFLGWRERLPRERGAGVRTAATMRGDEAFRLGNKVAGLPTLVGGLIGLLAGVAGLVMPTGGGTIVAAVVGLIGLVTLVVAGGVLGNRAAATVPAPAKLPAGCAGCACGAGGCGVFTKGTQPIEATGT